MSGKKTEMKSTRKRLSAEFKHQALLRAMKDCSRDHRDLLDAHGLISYMSAKGNCYDNAAM